MLTVLSANGRSDIRQAFQNIPLTLQCEDEQGNEVSVLLSVQEKIAVVIIQEMTENGTVEHMLMLRGQAQIRYGIDSPECGATPLLPLEEALQSMTRDATIFKLHLELLDRQEQRVCLTLRECGTTWILYGTPHYFRVIAGMPSYDELVRIL